MADNDKIRIANLPTLPSIPEEDWKTETVAIKSFAGALYTNVGRIGGSKNYWEIGEGSIRAIGETDNIVIAAGKTAFDNTETGFVLGVNQGTPKFYIGNATNFLNWTGVALAIKGKLIALANSEVDYSYIQNVAIENADIVSLSVNKLTAGSITSKAITLAIAAGTGDVKIQAGKTDFNNAASGFILGIDDSDSDKAKFYIGSTTVYMNWTGSALTIVGGTVTAGTIRTSASGGRVEMASDDTLKIYNTDGNLRINLTDNDLIFYSGGRIMYGGAADHLFDFLAAYIEAGKNFRPGEDNSYTLGTHDHRWSDARTMLLYAYTGIYCNSLLPRTGSDINFSGNAIPISAAAHHCGTAADYWNEVNYKSLNDRGCLGWFEKGVEMPNDKVVSDIEALQLIQKHPSLETVYGVPRFDYKTMPKAVYAPPPIAKKDIPDKEDPKKIRFKKGEKMGVDGAELSALVSIMIGALKDIDNRLRDIEVK